MQFTFGLTVLVFAFIYRSDRELLGPNNQYLPKIVAVFAEVSIILAVFDLVPLNIQYLEYILIISLFHNMLHLLDFISFKTKIIGRF